MDNSRKIIMALALLSGAGVTLAFTLQNKQMVTQAGITKHFYHPYMQTGLRAFSQFLCITVALSQKSKLQSQGYPKINPLLILIPQFIDLCTAFCYYIALNFVPGSIYQMLRGGTVLTTYFFTVTVLKNRPKKNKMVGCLGVLLGMIVVGIVNLLLGEKKDTPDEEGLVIVGYGLIILGICGSGLHFIVQEHLMKKYGLNALWLISLQGSYGIVLSALSIPFLAFAYCPFNDNACVFNDEGIAVVQNVGIYFREVFGNPLILVAFFAVTLMLAFYNATGVLITKKISSLARAVVDVSRTVLIWLAGVLITATFGSSNPTYVWQSLDVWQLLGQSFGFLLLILGNLVYYQLLTIKCLNEPSQPKDENENFTQSMLLPQDS